MKLMNLIVNYIQQRRVLQHLLFWITILLLSTPKGIILNEDSLYKALIKHFSVLPPQMLASYFLGYFVIPKFLLKKKYKVTIILVLLGTYVFSVLERIMVIYLGEFLLGNPPYMQAPILEILTDFRMLIKLYVLSIYSVSLLFLFVKYFKSYKEVKEKDLKLKKEKAESELKTLKAQLNPHFLFNTLNNIYTLSLANSSKAPTSIGKLSEILDHILYRCNEKFVTLSSELKLLYNYIELEKLRYDDRLEILFNKNIEKDIEIPPLILLSLVENAFKHGAGEDSGSPKITIDVFSEKAKFVFKITNTVSKEYKFDEKENIGLSNIKKQLNLIYENNYVLDINKVDNLFVVVLQINEN